MTLTASDRIKLIRSIAPRLSEEDWSLIDLTLDQFGLQTYSSWNGDKDSYLIESPKGASESVLLEIGRHVGIETDRSAVTQLEPPFWEAGAFRIFVSHLAAHRSFAGQLQENLSGYGITAFVAHNDIEPTTEWQTQIELALATCDALVALLHPDFHASNWTDQEIGYAMGRGVPTLAVRLGQDPYGFIGRFQGFNGAGKNAASLAQELFQSIRTNKQTAKRMAGVLVSLFERSGSFATAKERIGYLEDLEFWDSSFNSRLTSAAKNNNQISESWGVPARVEQLIARHKND